MAFAIFHIALAISVRFLTKTFMAVETIVRSRYYEYVPPSGKTPEGFNMALATQESTLAAITAALREQLRPASQPTAKPKEENHGTKSLDV